MRDAHSDEELRLAYAAFEDDHDRLRNELLAAVARGEHHRYLTTVPFVMRRLLAVSIATVAASFLIGMGVWLITGAASSRAYSFDGLQERLLKVRSLHVIGWTYRSMGIVDGREKVEKTPFELYVERPSRTWHTWIGIMPDGIRTGYRVSDGKRRLFVSHDDKIAALGKESQLGCELGVEVMLQYQWAQRLAGGVPSDYRSTGREEVNGVMANRYECRREAGGQKTRTVLWIHPDTGLPVRSAEYSGEEKAERLAQLNERIEFDVPPPRPDMFSFEPPSGYKLAQEPVEANAPFVRAMAVGGGREAAVREVFAIDDRAMLICWMNQPRADDVPQAQDAQPEPIRLKLELRGPSGNRPCEYFALRDQQDQNQVWHWSLVMPQDRKPIQSAETLSAEFQSKKAMLTFENSALRFDDSRLANLLTRLQKETFSDQSKEEAPFTLADLRKQVANRQAQ